MKRLIICGWNDGTAELADALEAHGLRTVATGDRRPDRLLRARARTSLPGYQHPLEMARCVGYDAALIDDEADAVAIAAVAAERGADLLITARAAGSEALASIDATARRAGVKVVLIGPLTHTVDFEAARLLTNGNPRWEAALTHIELSDEGSCTVLLRDAATIAARLVPHTPREAIVSLLGEDSTGAFAASAHLRYHRRQQVTIDVRAGAPPRARVRIEAPAGRIELEGHPEGRSVTVIQRSGDTQRGDFAPVDPVVLEAARIVNRVREDAEAELTVVQSASAALDAVEQSAETGLVTTVRDAGVRSRLRLLRGGAAVRSPRTGHLQLVGS
jgi:hypothetical protein